MILSDRNSEMQFKPEVLAPAGDSERAYAAAEAGADAVYFGLQSLSARSAARNIDLAELETLITDLHKQNVKAYLTLNTILYESEMEQAITYLEAAVAAGADALIVQDPAWLNLFSVYQPPVELHASTQMNIHSDFDLLAATKIGFQRVVLPREISADQLRIWNNLAHQQHLATEVFVHGALCMAVSGRCQMSFQQGGRSANRGACAQACRLRYRLFDSRGNRLDQGALLSAKDQSLLSAIPLLFESKTDSLKIEGRMKDVIYVKAATAAYREAVDLWAEQKNPLLFAEFAAEAELKLLQVFHRGDGFTKRSFAKESAENYVSKDFVGNHGELLGRIQSIDLKRGEIVYAPDADSNLTPRVRDQITVCRDYHRIAAAPIGVLRQAKGHIVIRGFHPDKLKLMRRGDLLYRLKNAALTKEIENQKPYRYGLSLHLTIGEAEIRIFSRIKLKNRMLDHETVVQLENFEVLSEAVSEERWQEQFAKTGNTIFKLEDFRMEYLEPLKTPPAIRISDINAIRRDLLAELSDRIKELTEEGKRDIQYAALSAFLKTDPAIDLPQKPVRSILSLNTADQLILIDKLPLADYEALELPLLFLTDLKINADLFKQIRLQNPDLIIFIRLPEIMQEREKKIAEKLLQNYLNDSQIGFSANGISVLMPEFFRNKLYHVNEQANIINPQSLSLYLRKSKASVALSPEWNDGSLNRYLDQLSDEECARIVILKDYLMPEMFLNYCPIGKNQAGCRRCVRNKVWSHTYRLETLQIPLTEHTIVPYPAVCFSQIYAERPDNAVWSSLSRRNQRRVAIKSGRIG